MNILIGGAWPYANGSLHIGHLAALLPGDVLARYWRLKGETVFYVSGSDCYGTPITVRARQEGRTPEKISDRFHAEFCDAFEKLGFSYDLYTKTSDPCHIAFVQAFHKRLYAGRYVAERAERQACCPACRKPLTDRLVVGLCPVCGAAARGDQCDACGEILDADTLLDAKCAECGSPVVFRETTQLFLLLTELRQELTALLESHPHWRKNAVAFTKRYLDEGLRDRAITRDLDWGIPVPKPGFEQKKIYIWAENVLGYLSASAAFCEERGIPFEAVFGENALHYYVHGKDNIPFHTIILPALLLAEGSGLHLPDVIVSSEYATLEGRKISTSRNHAVWVRDLAAQYNPDAIRYFFLANGPERRDMDFTFRAFAEQNNTELVGAWGNFVNRTLAFIRKYLGNTVPDGTPDPAVMRETARAFSEVSDKIEKARIREALDTAFELVRFGNKYYDRNEPWKTRTSAPEACADTLYNCTCLIANLAVLLSPFLPFSSEKLIRWLGLSTHWAVQAATPGKPLPEISILFSRIEPPSDEE